MLVAAICQAIIFIEIFNKCFLKEMRLDKKGLPSNRGRCANCATLSAHCNALDISDGWCVEDISDAHVNDIFVWLKQLDIRPWDLNRRDKRK